MLGQFVSPTDSRDQLSFHPVFGLGFHVVNEVNTVSDFASYFFLPRMDEVFFEPPAFKLHLFVFIDNTDNPDGQHQQKQYGSGTEKIEPAYADLADHR